MLPNFKKLSIWSAATLMEKLPAEKYLRLAHISAALANVLQNGVKDSNRDSVLENMMRVSDMLDTLGINAAKGGLEWLICNMKNDPPGDPSFDSYRGIMECAFSELKGKSFLYLGDNEGYFGDKSPFGEEFSLMFPEATEDLSSSSDCIAVGQYTASVFHLMRAIESCIKKLCEEIGVEKTDIEWGKLLSAMDSKIRGMPKGEKRTKWNDTRANLYHVKECWRNNTMHPKQTYTEGEAKDVFKACQIFVKSFCQLISEA